MVVSVTSEWSDTDLDDLIEEILVDAFGGDEQLGAFECVFSEAEFPLSGNLGAVQTARASRDRSSSTSNEALH